MQFFRSKLGVLGLLLLAVCALSAHGDPRLDLAKQLFRQGSEADCRRAANICIEVNNVEAAELMLDILETTGRGPGLPAGHYRDIVWEQIGNLTDPYAKARVELELKKGKTSPWVRAWCAELLGIYGNQDFAQTLTKALRDKDAEVRSAAAIALGRLPLAVGGAASKKAVTALAKLAHGKDPYPRANALIALLTLAPETWRPLFLGAIEGRAKDKDGGVRCALLGAWANFAPTEVEALAARSLADEDWRVRLKAVDLLGMTRSKTSIDRLIEATEDTRPTIRLRAIQHLQKLTKQVFHDSPAWQNWWTEHRDTFKFPEGDAEDDKATTKGETVAVYNGIRVDSDHVAFLIDKSSAMQERLNSQGKDKESFAQEQLAEVLAKLPDGILFNVYTYELEVQVYQSKHPVELHNKSVKKALAFVEHQRIRGSKDIWRVLEQVVSDPDIDTIYLLSSGEPDTGKYVHWNRVTAHLTDLNRFQNVTVHTIAYSDNEWYRDQLERIAVATGGEFKWFE